MGPDLADSHQRAIREKNRGSCQIHPKLSPELSHTNGYGNLQ